MLSHKRKKSSLESVCKCVSSIIYPSKHSPYTYTLISMALSYPKAVGPGEGPMAPTGGRTSHPTPAVSKSTQPPAEPQIYGIPGWWGRGYVQSWGGGRLSDLDILGCLIEMACSVMA